MIHEISALLFDLGGVLYHIDDSIMINEFNKLGAEDFSSIYNLSTQKPIIDKYEMGLITTIEFFNSIKPHLKNTLENYAILNAWNSMLIGMPMENYEILLELKKKYPIYLLSNTNIEHINYIDNEMANQYKEESLKSLFDDVIYSYEVNMRKPNLDIYEYTNSKIPFDKDKIFYIEDNHNNYEMGKNFGFNSYIMERNSNLKDFLIKTGIL
jgi:putative hydrolase of the HAD superfamily